MRSPGVGPQVRIAPGPAARFHAKRRFSSKRYRAALPQPGGIEGLLERYLAVRLPPEKYPRLGQSNSGECASQPATLARAARRITRTAVWGRVFGLRLRKERTRLAPSDHHETGHSALPDGMLEVHSVQVGDSLCVLVSGELDLGSADKLEEAIRAAEKATARAIVIDLTNLRFMDCRGLNVLLRAHTRSQQDGDRIRILPSKYDIVRQLVAVTGSSRIFD